MKRLLSAALVCLLSMSAFSQNLYDQLEGTFGFNVSSMKWYDSKLGFHAGVRATKNLDKEIASGIYANAGAMLSLKGGKLDLGDLGKSTINAYYLEIPVHIGYKHTLSENVKIFGEVGPYFDFGLFGNQSSTTIADIEGMKYEKESHSTFDVLNRFDFGVGFRIGAEVKKKYVFSLGYDAGIVNIAKGDDDDDCIDITGTVRSSNFYISAAYIF